MGNSAKKLTGPELNELESDEVTLVIEKKDALCSTKDQYMIWYGRIVNISPTDDAGQVYGPKWEKIGNLFKFNDYTSGETNIKYALPLEMDKDSECLDVKEGTTFWLEALETEEAWTIPEEFFLLRRDDKPLSTLLVVGIYAGKVTPPERVATEKAVKQREQQMASQKERQKKAKEKKRQTESQKQEAEKQRKFLMDRLQANVAAVRKLDQEIEKEKKTLDRSASISEGIHEGEPKETSLANDTRQNERKLPTCSLVPSGIELKCDEIINQDFESVTDIREVPLAERYTLRFEVRRPGAPTQFKIICIHQIALVNLLKSIPDLKMDPDKGIELKTFSGNCFLPLSETRKLANRLETELKKQVEMQAGERLIDDNVQKPQVQDEVGLEKTVRTKQLEKLQQKRDLLVAKQEVWLDKLQQTEEDPSRLSQILDWIKGDPLKEEPIEELKLDRVIDRDAELQKIFDEYPVQAKAMTRARLQPAARIPVVDAGVEAFEPGVEAFEPGVEDFEFESTDDFEEDAGVEPSQVATAGPGFGSRLQALFASSEDTKVQRATNVASRKDQKMRVPTKLSEAVEDPEEFEEPEESLCPPDCFDGTELQCSNFKVSGRQERAHCCREECGCEKVKKRGKQSKECRALPGRTEVTKGQTTNPLILKSQRERQRERETIRRSNFFGYSFSS